MFVNNLDSLQLRKFNGRETAMLLLSWSRKKASNSSQHNDTTIQTLFFSSYSFLFPSQSPRTFTLFDGFARNNFQTHFTFHESCYLGRERTNSYRFLGRILSAFFRRFSTKMEGRLPRSSKLDFLFPRLKIRSKTTSVFVDCVRPKYILIK